jgi:3-dehydro-4-phosphotetronate decarboxylase
LHRQIYAASADSPTAARCIIHTHSTHCVALTLCSTGAIQELLPPLTPYFVMKVGHVPLVPYHRPGDPNAATAVANVIVKYKNSGIPIRAVMLERLGPNVWHDSPSAAMAALEELEETAKLWQFSRSEAHTLTNDHIEELRQVFGVFW